MGGFTQKGEIVILHEEAQRVTTCEELISGKEKYNNNNNKTITNKA